MVIRTGEFKQEYLNQANQMVSEMEDRTPHDGYALCYGEYTGKQPWWGPLGNVIEQGINECLTLFGSRYNYVWHEAWVNVVRPKRRQTRQRHNHVLMNKEAGKPIPTFTWVYYMQMPSPVSGDEGKLEVEDIVDGTVKIERYFPNVGEFVILRGDQYHDIIDSPASTVNRVVLAGNVSIENTKQTKSLM